ncbi:IS1634 family transposase [Faecalibacillus faecis]|uniref:IS1634 family transposase n=4 Tax=Erysipelotrichales TaxID=526525 RepID=A0AAW4W272_9FIRM|nr:IS1634 family transposase [Faecalibacillus faecis]MCB8569438.1 IS1634 family transposase [Faecalibacillus faecis]MCB8611497.1 IS1634 family transposase [Faecalibacillus faecis]MCQ5201000.1 IS1634 family transposase [Faecalibacillus faecis]
MKLYYDKRLKDPTYYIQQGFRNGKKTTTKNIKRLGKHSELLLITDNPLEYAKNEVKKMNEEYRSGRSEFIVTMDFNERIPSTDSPCSNYTSLNIGYLYLKDIYAKLNLSDFFKSVSSDRKITYDCNKICQFLTYARILDPASKYGTYDKLDTYYEKPQVEYQHMIRFLDILDRNSDQYLKHLFDNSENIVKRDTSVMYYDCTNYFFETEKPDEEIVDEVTGEIILGLRQFGISKENKTSPIVEMGLIMDSRGIPISMCIHPGNTNEQLTAVPLEKEVIKMTGNKKFIYCADAGLGSYNIRKFNDMGGRAYIVTQSVKKLGQEIKDIVFNDSNYRLLSNDDAITLKEMRTFNKKDANNLSLYNDFAYKVIPANTAMDTGLYEEKVYKNGRTKKVKAKGTLHQYIIVTFSRKMMEYQRTIRERQLERAKKLLRLKDPEKIKKGPNDIRRFLKNTSSDTANYVLDMDKIHEEEKYDGFYAVATNLDDSAKDILAVAQNRYKIEDCFRIMKTNFDARPVFLRKPERIRAHFLICYTALLIYRLMECKLDDNLTHVTTSNLIKTLRNMNVVNMDDMYYKSIYSGSQALDALERCFELQLNRKYYRPSDLNKIVKKYSK